MYQLVAGVRSDPLADDRLSTICRGQTLKPLLSRLVVKASQQKKENDVGDPRPVLIDYDYRAEQRRLMRGKVGVTECGAHECARSSTTN